jgi:LmbE family N-acetylglucosaminyl deacetylase
MSINVLHLSPHPDDEIIGAGGTLQQLQGAGQQVSNWALTCGSQQSEQRRNELQAANQILGYQLIISDLDYQRSTADWPAYQRHWQQEYQELGQDFDLLIAPSPLDGHPAHEAAGRLALSLAVTADTPVWFWGLWADLPVTNLLSEISSPTVDKLLAALAAHHSQLQQRNWVSFLPQRIRSQAVIAPNRVFGWGSAPEISSYGAELLLEIIPQAAGLIASQPRIIDWNHPLDSRPSGRDLSQLLLAPSWSKRLLLNQ